MARRSRPIERITLEAAFRIPFSEPTLQEFPSLRKYKTSVDREFREIFKAHSTSPESFPDRTGIGRDARIIRDGEVIDRFWLSSEHDLFPQNADPSVRNLISVSLIEVALYREPVDPQSFVLTRLGLVSTAAPLPERMEPDLGIEDRPDAVHWRFTARYSEDRDYQLHLREWTPNRSDWRQNGSRLAFEDDLAGSQLIIDFGGNTPRLAPVRASFDLVLVTLYINERPIRIPIEDVTKHIVQNQESDQRGQPFWEYRFPEDTDLVFFQPPNRGVRPKVTFGRN